MYLKKLVISRAYGLSKTYKTNKTYINKINNTSTTHAYAREISISKWQEFLKSYKLNKATHMLLIVLGVKFSRLEKLTQNVLTWAKKFIETPGKEEEKIQFLQEYCERLEPETVGV